MTDKATFFLPGPVHVRKKIVNTMASPIIGHRSPEFSELYERVVSGLREIMFTEGRVYLSTSTATGLMEAAVRNVVRERSLHLVCGAFSELWHKIAIGCGFDTDTITVDYGMAIKPDMVEEALSTGEYDTVCMTHSETSTGVLNPLKKIAAVVAKFDHVALLVDAVSSMAGTKIEVDKLGIDVCLASVQKAWALPPGFAVCSVSDYAMERSSRAKNKGYYFDFEVFEKYNRRSQTVSTASTPHMFALAQQIDDIMVEGLDERFARHQVMAERVREWAEHHFTLFAEEGFRSPTVTCIKNETGIDTGDIVSTLKDWGYVISNGYGKIKGLTFRIGHMGDVQPADIEELLSTFDAVIEELK